MNEPTDHEVLQAAYSAGLCAHMTVDVLLFQEGGHSLCRTLSSVSVKYEWGKRWLELRWKRDGETPWGTPDCGYAGWVVDAELMGVLAKMADARKPDDQTCGSCGDIHDTLTPCEDAQEAPHDQP